jgi:hypothetical protein
MWRNKNENKDKARVRRKVHGHPLLDVDFFFSKFFEEKLKLKFL